MGYSFSVPALCLIGFISLYSSSLLCRNEPTGVLCRRLGQGGSRQDSDLGENRPRRREAGARGGWCRDPARGDAPRRGGTPDGRDGETERAHGVPRDGEWGRSEVGLRREGGAAETVRAAVALAVVGLLLLFTRCKTHRFFFVCF